MSLLVGCGQKGQGVPQEHVNMQVPRLTNVNDREMPLDEYLLNPAQLESVSSAYSLSIAQCMRSYGYTFEVPISPLNLGIGDDAPKTRTDGRFGFQSMDHAKKLGYHPAGGFPQYKKGSTGSGVDREEWFALTGSRDLGKLSGPGGPIQDGDKVLSNGCVGNALLKITGSRNGHIGDSEVATELKFETLTEGQTDERTRKVFSLWSRCMQEYKYSYRSPLDAMNDPQWGKSDQPFATEIRTAVADQKCRARHNVVGVWFAADFESQERAVLDNQEKLIKAKRLITRQVQAALKILKRS
ncbi:hypothetical protein [Streptomyces chartreusis]|uniref:hypothetical protein n=1 Tax=Streptomyces chartreusis TaxID=1969 RepID=UPI00364EBDD8